MRWLVVGHLGMLGHDLVAALDGRDVVGVGRQEADITDPAAVTAVVHGFDVVVNCAAWTAVDDAEAHEAAAFAVNAVGPANLARACATTGARLFQVSTDYVFAGDATTPYAEDAPPAPRSAYGRTKLAGEWAVRSLHPEGASVVRTAWLYGGVGTSFVRTMVRLEAQKDTLDVVDDQRGQPTWSADLARQLVALADADAPARTYHATSSGSTTWHGFTRRIFELLGADPARVRATTSAAFVRPAPRPAWSVLGHEGWAGTGIAPIRAWDEALSEALPQLQRGWAQQEAQRADSSA